MNNIQAASLAFRDIVSDGAKLAHLGGGFVAGEGPVWVESQQCLLFSDYRASRRYRWAESDGITLVADGTNEGNGQTLDQDGRLYICERATQRVIRQTVSGAREVVVDRWRGARLNAPNDIIVDSNGAVFFTDPISPDYESERGYPGVFRLAPGQTEPVLLTKEIKFPNGLALSPDESVLYVNDSKRQAVFTVATGPDEVGEPRLFYSFDTAQGPGVPDGLKVDLTGNVYSTGPGGVWVIGPGGDLLGIISTGPHHHTNLAWGGCDWRTLFITTRESLSRINVKIPGIPVPARPTT